MNEPLTPRMKQEEPSTELVTNVFVYGTLKSGGQLRGLDLFPADHRELQGKYAKSRFLWSLCYLLQFYAHTGLDQNPTGYAPRRRFPCIGV